jgi:hypothetical protein
MAKSGTLAFIIHRVLSRYGRNTKKIRQNLVGDLEMWIERTCRRWPLWFMVAEPDTVFLNGFPRTQAAFEALDGEHGWVAPGWLKTSDEGQATYSLWWPRFLPPHLGGVEPEDGETSKAASWEPVEAKSIVYVKEINLDGTLARDLEVHDNFDILLSNPRFASEGTPRKCAWQTRDGVTSLTFDCQPDKQYLYQVCFRLARWPGQLNRPDSCHPMMWYYPEVVIKAGQYIFANEYWHEKEEAMKHGMDLYGNGYLQDASESRTPGGMLGEIIAESQNRSHQKNPQVGVYTSSRAALGRGGPIAGKSPRGYYFG